MESANIEKDGNIIVNADHMEVYIPLELFDDEKVSVDVTHAAVASSYGEGFRIIALANVRVAFNAEDDITKTPLHTLNYPQLIETYPTSSYETLMTLIPGDEPQKYKVLSYIRGDILMSANIPRNADNCTKFLDLLIKGKIPKTIAYQDIYKAWRRNLEINNVNPGVPAVYLQAIIAEIYRCRNNPGMSFRMIYGNDMTRNDYDVTNMRGTAAKSGVFIGQIFEDMGRMLVNGINISRRGLPQAQSPIECVLYM